MGSYQIGQNGYDLRRDHVASVHRSMVWGAGFLEGYECAHGYAWVASGCIARMKSDSELVVGDVLNPRKDGRIFMSETKQTTDHQKIRQWVEERGGRPAAVKGTGRGNDPGVLRIDFPDYSGDDTLEPISWEQFFDKFEKEQLAFLYQDETKEGGESRFSKLTNREEAKRTKKARTR